MRINLRVSIVLAATVLILLVVLTPFTLGEDVSADGSIRSKGRGAFVKAQKVVILYAEVDGRIVDIPYRPQDFVKSGEVLMGLDDSMTQLDRLSIEAKLDLNTITSEQNKIRYQYAKESLEIVRKIYETKVGDVRVAPLKELKEAEQMEHIARLQIKVDVEERGLLELNVVQYDELLGRYKVKAPVAGVLVPLSSVDVLRDRKRKQPEVGEWVRAGQPVAALIKVDRLRVVKTLDVKYLDKWQVGQPVQVFLEKASSKPVSAKVVFKGPTISITDDFSVEVEFDNPEIVPKASDRFTYRYRYRPGTRAWVELLPKK